MMSYPPKKMSCPSDGNELALISIEQPKLRQKELIYLYGYTKSANKMGKTLPITDSVLRNFIGNRIFVEI